MLEKIQTRHAAISLHVALTSLFIGYLFTDVCFSQRTDVLKDWYYLIQNNSYLPTTVKIGMCLWSAVSFGSVLIDVVHYVKSAKLRQAGVESQASLFATIILSVWNAALACYFVLLAVALPNTVLK